MGAVVKREARAEHLAIELGKNLIDPHVDDLTVGSDATTDQELAGRNHLVFGRTAVRDDRRVFRREDVNIFCFARRICAVRPGDAQADRTAARLGIDVRGMLLMAELTVAEVPGRLTDRAQARIGQRHGQRRRAPGSQENSRPVRSGRRDRRDGRNVVFKDGGQGRIAVHLIGLCVAFAVHQPAEHRVSVVRPGRQVQDFAVAAREAARFAAINLLPGDAAATGALARDRQCTPLFLMSKFWHGKHVKEK